MNESFQNLRSELEDKEYAHGYFEEHLNEYIAAQIKVLREQRGWTQEKLAEESGMAQERVSVLEDVNYSSWTVNTLRKLAWAFDLRVHVSFESFSSGIQQVISFGADALKRRSREEDLGFEPSADVATDNQTVGAIYTWATHTNGATQAGRNPLTLVRLKSATIPPAHKESGQDETTVDKLSPSDLAVSPHRPKSARESIRAKRAA